MQRSDVFFGRNIGAMEGVSDTAWQNFLDQEIVPRFPNGLTLVASNGQWRGPDGRSISERDFVLTVLGDGGADELRKLDAAPIAPASCRMRFFWCKHESALDSDFQ